MKPKRLICLFFALLCASVRLVAVHGEEVVGLSIIQEAANPLHYATEQFAVNPLSALDISRCESEADITAYLNSMNVGKQILNYLLDYDVRQMNPQRLFQRSGAKDGALSDAACAAALLNNYVLVVKMDDESLRRALQGDTLSFLPEGQWYLYRPVCDEDLLPEVRKFFFRDDDTPELRGAKRVGYEGISVPLQLVATGTNIRESLSREITRTIRQVSTADAKRGYGQTHVRRTGKVLRWALSPLVILQK